MDKLLATKDSKRLKEHGGNVKRLAEKLGIGAEKLLDFSSNINPYGPPESVIRAAEQALNLINEYPEQQGESFIGAIAKAFGIGNENIVAGNGTIELIYVIPQVFKINRALLITPSFTEYELSLYKAGADIVYKESFTAKDAIRLLKNGLSHIDIAIIGNPNNPCGYCINKDDLIEAIDNNPGCLWVIDEAFIDFARNGPEISLIYESVTRRNLIVLRSLTKIYSIAGLRLGYMVASVEVATKVRDEKYPWSVNSIALAAGIAAMNEGSFVEESVEKLTQEACRLCGEISTITGLTAYKPTANYVLIKIEDRMSSAQLQEILLKRGIAIRDCSSYTGMDDKHIRVAVKRPEDNDKLLDALRAVMTRCQY